MKLLGASKESGAFAMEANPEDTTYLVPAFSGLGAPYWDSEAKAAIVGMTRNTGKAEIVRAAEECIGYQIADLVFLMQEASGLPVKELRVDGGPTKDKFLMQFQSDLLNIPIAVPKNEELSGIGAAYAAGFALGFWDQSVYEKESHTRYTPQMDRRNPRTEVRRLESGGAERADEVKSIPLTARKGAKNHEILH